MWIELTKQEANVIQVAIDHLYEMHTDVLADALKSGDNEEVRRSYHIQCMIEDIHEQIKNQLNK